MNEREIKWDYSTGSGRCRKNHPYYIHGAKVCLAEGNHDLG